LQKRELDGKITLKLISNLIGHFQLSTRYTDVETKIAKGCTVRQMDIAYSGLYV